MWQRGFGKNPMHKALLFLCLFSLSLGQFSNVGKDSGANIYFFDIFIAIYGLYGLVSLLNSRNFTIPKYYFFILIFIPTALSSLLLNGFRLLPSEVLISSLYLIRLCLYVLSGLVTYNLLKANKLNKGDVEALLIYSGLFIGLAGLAQLILLPDFTKLDPLLGWDPHKNRLASTFYDPNFTGAYLSIVGAILLNKIFTKEVEKRDLGKYGLYLLFIVICIFLTFSRSAWLMLGIVILVFGLFNSKLLLYLSLIIVFLAYFAVPRVQTRISGITDPADSAHFRLLSWKNALTIWQDYPYFGVGFNTFRYAQRDYGFLTPDTILSHSGAGADSSFIFVLVTTGIAGFVIFSLWWFLPVMEMLLSAKNRDLVLLSVLLGVFFSSQFINSVFYPQILFAVLILLAISSLSRT